MCGIFGYTGEKTSPSLFIKGLSRLEYRGYDSCGLAGIVKGKVFLKKRPGKIGQLKKDLRKNRNIKIPICILHTRWATHGSPNKANAHPHTDCKKEIAIVHNGIIENYLQLKNELIKKGHKFVSQTDTEVIAHLIENFYNGSSKTEMTLEKAVLKAVKKLKGSFSLGVISKKDPEKLIAVRKGSPLIIGVGKNRSFLASDISALLVFVNKVIYLGDEEIAILMKEKIKVINFKGEVIQPEIEDVKIKLEEADKRGSEHFMLKEIFEQPKVIRKIFSSYHPTEGFNFPELRFSKDYLKELDKIYITACGTAYHAGYVAKYFLEKYCGLDVEIDVSSEFRYRRLNLKKGSLVIAISQSGETADTLASVREAKAQGAKILSVCNVMGSSLVKESDSVIFTLAGPEISVASTKAYTAQVFCLYLFSLFLGKLKKTLTEEAIGTILKELEKIPFYQEEILKQSWKVRKIANRFSKFGSFLFLGRGINYPSALEGALKLKEISYIPAEGYPAGEMKHGPIALIDEYRAIVCIAPKDELHEKMISNMQEAKARKGKILALINDNDDQASSLSHNVIYIPQVLNQDLSPLLVAVCLQLFAYFVAKKRKCEIDQPRNLAKSVTVE